MTNHLHLVVQVGDMPLAKILQNISFRYTRYINKKKKRNGHLFQGRYKAILIDADSYLLELVRYIHNNPLRTGQVNKPEQYQWSSHRAYLDKETVTWLTTDFVLSQFAKNEKKARQQFQAFCLKGGNEERREEFYQGTFDGRILGDEGFSENVLAMAKERFHAPVSVEQLVKVVCKVYRMNEQAIVVPGKHQPGAEARAVVAYLAQEAGKPSLTELGKYFQRDPTAMSRAAGRLRERLANDRALTARLKKVKSSLK
jgi:putative transposase